MMAALTTAHSNKKLVRTLYDCINARKLDEMQALIAPDFTGPRGERGPAEFRAGIETVLTGFPGVRFELHDVFAEDDRVAVRWTFRAPHDGRFAGLPPTHALVTQEGNVIYQLREGQIVRAWVQVDRLGVLQQIGALPPSFADSRAARPI
ncbi:ester cyclase [Massilia sp. IC2-476]|uniref:ester cyclase n=1 Tax=Massilia sp. IC2-476 TaxID=2887199 RepID=UPI001D1221A8|nr:ester cyclase [Massilia sp. IC2-476]MCC2971460.1 ester cyclase [Massilia sp. IC2-476]